MGNKRKQIHNLSKDRPKAAEQKNYVDSKKNPSDGFNTLQIYNRIYTSSIDIKRWRNAYTSAVGDNKDRSSLYNNLYPEIGLDAHLTGVMNARINKVLGNEFKIVDENGKEDIKSTMLFESQWFYTFLRYCMESIFWGYSLIEFDDVIDDKFSCVELYPRVFVKPEFGVITEDLWETEGFDYTKEPFATWHVCAGDKYDLGLLNKVAPYVIMKRNALNAMAERAEVFGMPIKVSNSPKTDEKTRRILERDIVRMGQSAGIVLDLDSTIEFKETGNADGHQIYLTLIDICNKEISKLVLGQTMTTEDGSSLSQAEVHENVSNDVARMDMRMLEFLMNDQLIPNMIKIGFSLKGLHFKFDHSEKLSLVQLATISTNFINTGKFDVNEDTEKWVTEKFGIPLKKLEVQPINSQPFGDGGAKKLATNQMSNTISNTSEQIKEIYSALGDMDIVNEADNPFTEKEGEDLIQKIYSGVINLKKLPKNILDKTLNYLLKGVVQGFGGAVSDFELGTPYEEMITALNENISVFSQAKTITQVEEMMSFLVEDGEVVSFNEFKKKALDVYKDYNVTYLNTEYGVAVGQSRNAAYWVDIEDKKEVLPYLKYQTVGDGRVRPSHKALDGIIRRVDDAFWKKYMPMNGWKCRCIVQQIAEGKETDLSNFKAPTDVPELFQMNPGIDKVVFSDEHPYFKTEKRIKKKK